MNKTPYAAFAAICLVASSPALSDPAASDAAAAAKTGDEGQNKVVCRRVDSIGTRLSSKRVCRTKAEWAAEAAANRQDLERSQTQRWKSD